VGLVCAVGFRTYHPPRPQIEWLQAEVTGEFEAEGELVATLSASLSVGFSQFRYPTGKDK